MVGGFDASAQPLQGADDLRDDLAAAAPSIGFGQQRADLGGRDVLGEPLLEVRPYLVGQALGRTQQPGGEGALTDPLLYQRQAPGGALLRENRQRLLEHGGVGDGGTQNRGQGIAVTVVKVQVEGRDGSASHFGIRMAEQTRDRRCMTRTTLAVLGEQPVSGLDEYKGRRRVEAAVPQAGEHPGQPAEAQRGGGVEPGVDTVHGAARRRPAPFRVAPCQLRPSFTGTSLSNSTSRAAAAERSGAGSAERGLGTVPDAQGFFLAGHWAEQLSLAVSAGLPVLLGQLSHPDPTVRRILAVVLAYTNALPDDIVPELRAAHMVPVDLEAARWTIVPRVGLTYRPAFRRTAEAHRPVVRCGDTGADGTVVSGREFPGRRTR